MKLSSRLTRLAVAGALCVPALVRAGSIVHVQVTDFNNPGDSTDDTAVTKPLRWDSEDYDSGLPVYLYRSIPFTESVLPPLTGVLANQPPEGFTVDDEILAGLRRGIEQWNGSDYTEFQFTGNPLFSDQALVWPPEEFPFGLVDAALDRYNLITFQDSSFATLPAGVLYSPVVFYFAESFDRETFEDDPTDNIEIEAVDTNGDGLADTDIVTIRGRDKDLTFLLPNREWDSGTIIDVDIIMNATPNAEGWYLLPEDEDNLNTTIPPLQLTDVMGGEDIQAAMTRALGEIAGLGASHLYLSTMTPFYAGTDTQNDDQLAFNYLTNPYDFRDISLDDRLTMSRAYPSGDYDSAGGFGGSLVDGRSSDFVFEQGEIPAPINQIIYFGHPVTAGTPITLDTVSVVNSRGTWAGMEEEVVGPIRLVAHTVNGERQRTPLGPNSDAANLVLNSRFELRGLPQRDDWYIFAAPAEFSWDTPSADNLGGDPAAYPPEFFGGVADPIVDRYGAFPVPDFDDSNPLTIRNEWAVVRLGNTGIDLNGDEVIDDTETDTYGGFSAEIANGPQYLAESLLEGELVVFRVVDDATGAFLAQFSSFDLAVEGSTSFVSDDNLDTITIEHSITDGLGNQLGILSQDIVLRAYPTFGDLEKRGFESTWRFDNTSARPLRFGLAKIYRLVSGIPGNTLLGSVEMYVNGELQTFSTGFGLPGEDPVPASVDWFDDPHAPFLQFSVFGDMQGEGLTKPDRLLTVDYVKVREDIDRVWNMPPGGQLQFQTGALQASAGVITRWNPRPVAVGSSVSITTGGTYVVDPGVGDPEISDIRGVENGIAPTTIPEETFADEADLGFALSTLNNKYLDPVDIFTNRGTRLLNSADDSDGDGIPDVVDNCPFVANPDQADTNGNGIGDVCEGDFDGDGIPDETDNCPTTPNFDQQDIDGDGEGDACDDDIDNDGIENSDDNCPYVQNPSQEDSDDDGVGDVCETDFDGDGVPDEFDNCPVTPNPAQSDLDSDGIGDTCDPDIDGDGIPNTTDNCLDTPNPDQADADGDGIGDLCENTIAPLLEKSPASVPLFVNGDRVAQLPPDELVASSVASGDLNGDGYADLIIGIRGFGTSPNAGRTNRIYLNEGASKPGFFTDVTFGIDGRINTSDDRWLQPFSVSQFATNHVLLLDIDLDGDLDVYVATGDLDSATTDPDQLWLNVDEDDPTRNPTPDDDELGDGFFWNVTQQGLPGILNAKQTPLERIAPDITTRCAAVDVDADGDLDIVVGNADTGFDLALTTAPNAIDEGGNPHGFVASQLPFRFSERILINRRNELRFSNTTNDGPGGVIPRGTPDAFIVQEAHNTAAQVYKPFDPVGANPDGYWFRDETFGRDGIINGVGGPTSQVNSDRLPPLLNDFIPTPTNTADNREDDPSLTAQIAVGRHWQAGIGADIFVGNQRGVNEASRGFRYAGYDPMYVNGDVFGVDLIPDGYYYQSNFAPEFFDIASGSRLPVRIGVPDGLDGFFEIDDVTDDLPTNRSLTTGVVAVDLWNVGWGDFIEVTQNTPNSPDFAIAGPGTQVLTAFRPGVNLRPGVSRNIDGEPFGGFTAGFDLNNTVAGLDPAGFSFEGTITQHSEYVLSIFAPVATGSPFRTIGRTRAVDVGDIDRSGFKDILTISDAPEGSSLNTATTVGGFTDLMINADDNGYQSPPDAPESFVHLGASALRPNPAINGSYIHVFDADSDGDLDVFGCVSAGQQRLWINQLYQPGLKPDLQSVADRAIYHDVTRDMIDDTIGAGLVSPIFGTDIIPVFSSLTSDLVAGDVDRDGDHDIAVINGKSLTSEGDISEILTNRGKERPAGYAVYTPASTSFPAGRTASSGFTDLSGLFKLGLEQQRLPGSRAKFFDFDLDGDLDMVVSYYTVRNILYENRDANADDLMATGNPFLVGQPTGIFNSMWFWDDFELRDTAVFDADQLAIEMLGDGIMEQRPDRLAISDQTLDQFVFTNEVAIGDADNDGDLDMYFVNSSSNFGVPNALLINKPVGTEGTNPNFWKSRRFEDDSQIRLPQVVFADSTTGVQEDDSLSAIFLDADNDGDQDILVANRRSTAAVANPDFVETSQLLINQGGVQGGAVGFFEASATFPPIDPSTGQPLRLLSSRITAADFFRRGDVAEDINGDGQVEDLETLNFENIVAALQAEEDAGAARFPGGVVPITSRADGEYTIPVIQLAKLDSGFTRLTKRAPRYVDMNQNGSFDQVLDVIIVTSSGRDHYFRYEGLNGDNEPTYSLATSTAYLTDPNIPSTDIDVGDIDLDGWLDIVVSTSTSDPAAASVQMFANVDAGGGQRALFQTTAEIPYTPSTGIGVRDGLPSTTGDVHGNAQAVLLVDGDNDGDLDLMVGEGGGTIGIDSIGALNAFYENRVIGAGFLAPPRDPLISVPGGTLPTGSQPQVNQVSPRSATKGQVATLRLYGRNFRNGASVSLGSDIDVLYAPIVRSPEIIDVTVDLSGARTGPRSVRVINPNGKAATSPGDALLVVLPAPPGSDVPDWSIY